MLVVLLVFAVAMLSMIVTMLELDARDERARLRSATVVPEPAPARTPSFSPRPVSAPAGLRVAAG
jgi:hypothetical protein